MPAEHAAVLEFDPQRLLRATIDALGSMDVSALMKLGAEAEAMAKLRPQMTRVNTNLRLIFARGYALYPMPFSIPRI